MTYPDAIIDKRVVNRYIERGVVEPAVLDKHIRALPDCQSNAAQIEAEQKPDDQNLDEHVRSVE